MSKICFAMGLHFHQPVGNFPEVLERGYQDCYKPFFDILEAWPDIKMTVHISGSLLDWFEENHPELIEKISGLLERGQVEIMGGGYYEPIFPAIPRKDAIGQMKKTSDYIKSKFEVTPRGLWIPERVWSPELAELFLRSGYRYSILDETHFIKAGVSGEDLTGYYYTRYRNSKFAVFASVKKLRYDIPFKSPSETIDYFKSSRGEKDPSLFTYGDDGEKFGMWPGTNRWVYKEGWLENFFESLLKNRQIIETVKFSDYMDSHPPRGEIRIPEASYDEMLDWSDGSWTNFLLKYPESDHMHKRMYYISEKIAQLEKAKPAESHKGLLEEARQELYKGQCNCSYWHGLFGGIYLYHLRKATYEHLIKAGKIVDGIIHPGTKDWLNIEKRDFSIIIENSDISIYVDPRHGGIIHELDYKPLSVNLINTIRRTEESYHSQIRNLPDKPGYDRYIKGCLADHFIQEGLNQQDMELAGCRYSAKRRPQGLILTCRGRIREIPYFLCKEIKLNQAGQIDISYRLKNLGKSILRTVFGIEFNITMPYANSERYLYVSGKTLGGDMNKDGVLRWPDSFGIKDSTGELDMHFAFPLKPQDIRYFPIKTVSRSETGFEMNYQSSCIMPRWPVEINRGKEVIFGIKWTIKKSGRGFRW